jgi:hypothetical protein
MVEAAKMQQKWVFTTNTTNCLIKCELNDAKPYMFETTLR